MSTALDVIHDLQAGTSRFPRSESAKLPSAPPPATRPCRVRLPLKGLR